jgi:hypothetical protein
MVYKDGVHAAWAGADGVHYETESQAIASLRSNPDNSFRDRLRSANQATGGTQAGARAAVDAQLDNLGPNEITARRNVQRTLMYGFERKDERICTIYERDSAGQFFKFADFIITDVSISSREKMQVVNTFSDPVVFFYGSMPEFASFQGMLLNSNIYDLPGQSAYTRTQGSNTSNVAGQHPIWKWRFIQNYEERFKASASLQRGHSIFIVYDDVCLECRITGFNFSQNAANDKLVPFNFSVFIIKKFPIDPQGEKEEGRENDLIRFLQPSEQQEVYFQLSDVNREVEDSSAFSGREDTSNMFTSALGGDFTGLTDHVTGQGGGSKGEMYTRIADNLEGSGLGILKPVGYMLTGDRNAEETSERENSYAASVSSSVQGGSSDTRSASSVDGDSYSEDVARRTHKGIAREVVDAPDSSATPATSEIASGSISGGGGASIVGDVSGNEVPALNVAQYIETEITDAVSYQILPVSTGVPPAQDADNTAEAWSESIMSAKGEITPDIEVNVPPEEVEEMATNHQVVQTAVGRGGRLLGYLSDGIASAVGRQAGSSLASAAGSALVTGIKYGGSD